MIKVIIFDADGMVIHGERFSTRFAKKFDVPIEKINPFFENEFKDCILGKKDLIETIKPYLEMWGYKGTIGNLLDFWFSESYQIDDFTIQKSKEFISEGKICVLAINQDKYRTSYIKNEMGLGKIFDSVISSSDIGFKKPQKEFFGRLMNKLPDIKNDEVLFFDDREENIKAAQEFGFKAKLYKNIKDLENIY